MNLKRRVPLVLILVVNILLVAAIFYTFLTSSYTLFAVLIIVFVLFGIGISFAAPKLKKWAEKQPPKGNMVKSVVEPLLK